jgi:hypothetical protein
MNDEQKKGDFPHFFEVLGRIPNDKEVSELQKINLQNRSQYDSYLNSKKPIELIPEVPETPKDPVDVQAGLDAKALSEQMALEAQGRREKEEYEAKERLAEQEAKKNRDAYNREFDGELPRHRELRKAILESGNLKTEQRLKLLQEYSDLHYEYPQVVPTFKKVVHYECEQMGLKFVKQNGKWVVKGIHDYDLERFKETPTVSVDPETKLPIGYTFLIRNMGLYQLKKSGQYADLKIKLED